MTHTTPRVIALLTAATLIARQVRGNAHARWAVPVPLAGSKPYVFHGGSAVLAIVASQLPGRLLACRGPSLQPSWRRNAALFLVEWFHCPLLLSPLAAQPLATTALPPAGPS